MSDHSRVLRARSSNRLTDVAELLAGALMPSGDDPCSWLVRVGPPTSACRPRAGGPDDRADHHAATRSAERADATVSRSPVDTAPPLEDCICLLPLDPITECPLDALLGMVAPADWWALGVVATAKARRVDRPGQPATAVLVVLLVDRSGRTVSLVPKLDGGGSYENMPVTAGPEGVLLDLCRRALGLPTAPPEHPPMTWWAQLWLDAVLRDAAAEPCRPWTWPTLMARHPLCDLVRPLDGRSAADGAGGWPDPDPDPWGPDRFARAVEEAVSGYDWDRLRRAGLVGPNRDVAAWMDEGCFARWTLGANPDVPDLLAALQSLLPAEAVGSVTAVLDRWGVLG